MAGINDILRRSTMLDTSGAEAPRGIQMIPALGAGVYTNADVASTEDPLVGRISLGIIGAFVLGAVAFYVWTNGIQGGG